ncbi:MAG: epimerase [Deltaproteobacteria bacterium]|nr:epimerase [Deltaproteobacteria bacterium]
MIGQGVLNECLRDPRVEEILVVGRSACGVEHEKLREVLCSDFFDYRAIEERLAGYDACFFCLGVSSAGMSEAEYRRLTYDLTMRAAETLVRVSPEMTFCYVSGAGTDGTEKGRSMWARVKGKTENDLLALPFAASFMFRPGYVQPGPGVRSKTALYRIAYGALGPLYPVWRRLLPGIVTTSANVGRAMIAAASGGYEKRILEVRDINALAERA